ncbi:YggT family protein [Superficieibacter sp.]|uniref:YggT family protein n=1 Tax=Superficieibacter sp. TaxID=2303322 RepID=UPI0028AC060D|nr:YggT family protein [Superficieibacter sp.]
MNTLSTLLSLVIQVYTMILLLRIWMQWARCDFYNPFAQFIVKATQPIIGPLRRFVPAMGSIDTASLLLALILCIGKVFLNPYVSITGILIPFAAVLVLIKTVGSLIFWVVLAMSLMSWISRGRSPVEYVLIQLTEPLLRPIRNLLPSMSGIDFSPMILVLLMYVINMGVMELLANVATPLAYIWGWA